MFQMRCLAGQYTYTFSSAGKVPIGWQRREYHFKSHLHECNIETTNVHKRQQASKGHKLHTYCMVERMANEQQQYFLAKLQIIRSSYVGAYEWMPLVISM